MEGHDSSTKRFHVVMLPLCAAPILCSSLQLASHREVRLVGRPESAAGVSATRGAGSRASPCGPAAEGQRVGRGHEALAALAQARVGGGLASPRRLLAHKRC